MFRTSYLYLSKLGVNDLCDSLQICTFPINSAHKIDNSPTLPLHPTLPYRIPLPTHILPQPGHVALVVRVELEVVDEEPERRAMLSLERNYYARITVIRSTDIP